MRVKYEKQFIEEDIMSKEEEEVNKYYVPSIKEFRVGFEYEWSEFGRKIWIKETADQDDVLSAYSSWEHSEDFKAEYRVKHLDKADIEECGFEYITIEDSHVIGRRTAVFRKRVMRYRHDLYFNGNMLSIEIDDIMVFQGKIKNKNEFKVLLSQLGIS